MTTSQIFTIIFGLLGGLGLFLYGMKSMSEGLQKTSGDSLKRILEKLTTNRFVGTGVGIVVTTIIQSSSATTVMVVGFVNAGLMNLTQSLSVILGANVGTTITGQIIAFKVTAISMPCVAVGVLLMLFAKKTSLKYIGEIVFGLGLLFFGMDIMTKSFIPLAKSESFRQIFLIFSTHPLLAVLAGTITTLIVQSSSATMGITIALATTGALDFQAAAALVLGENIGTTITANLAAIGASRTAKQAALGHFLINAFGVAYMLVFLHFFVELVNWFTPNDANFIAADGTRPYIARHIANIHTSFNVINTIIFLPLLHVLAKICEKIIKPDKRIKELPKIVHLSDALTSTPEIAVGLVHKEVSRMFQTSVNILTYSKGALINKSEEEATFGEDLKGHLELFNKEIASFVKKLLTKPLSERSEKLIGNMLHSVDEINQIGERSLKLIKSYHKIEDKKIEFSEDALIELETIFNNVCKFAETALNIFNNGKTTEDLAALESEIDKQRKIFKKNHIKRFNEGKCSLEGGLLFVDLLNTLEKIGDNVYSISQLTLIKKVYK